MALLLSRPIFTKSFFLRTQLTLQQLFSITSHSNSFASDFQKHPLTWNIWKWQQMAAGAQQCSASSLSSQQIPSRKPQVPPHLPRQGPSADPDTPSPPDPPRLLTPQHFVKTHKGTAKHDVNPVMRFPQGAEADGGLAHALKCKLGF